MKIMYKRILAIIVVILQGIGYSHVFANERYTIFGMLCFLVSGVVMGLIVETDTYE